MINLDPDITQKEVTGRIPGTDPSREISFCDVLDTVAKAQTGKVISSRPAADTETILPTQRIDQSILGQVETLLDTMEQYRQDLLNPGKDLMELDRTLRRMDLQVQELRKESEGLSPELKNLTERITLTAEMERVRFDRGDYL